MSNDFPSGRRWNNRLMYLKGHKFKNRHHASCGTTRSCRGSLVMLDRFTDKQVLHGEVIKCHYPPPPSLKVSIYSSSYKEIIKWLSLTYVNICFKCASLWSLSAQSISIDCALIQIHFVSEIQSVCKCLMQRRLWRTVRATVIWTSCQLRPHWLKWQKR